MDIEQTGLRAHRRPPLHIRLHEDVVDERELEVTVETDELARGTGKAFDRRSIHGDAARLS